MVGNKHDSREKQIVYAEGLRHGFEFARDLVHDMSKGYLTLNEPKEITEWRKRERWFRDELREERRAPTKEP